MLNIFSKLLDINQRELDRISKIVEKINSLEPKIKKLKDKDFSKKTQELKEKVLQGDPLENILPEAFALVREAAWRAIGQRHFDVQLMKEKLPNKKPVREKRSRPYLPYTFEPSKEKESI
jgi:preprotein translocase subunit SecA